MKPNKGQLMIINGNTRIGKKKIIKTATLNIEVKNFQKYYNALQAGISRTGGYVAHENQTHTEFKTESVVSIKVPLAHFDEAVKLLIEGEGHGKLIEKTISSEDVTGQVIDTKSRLETKRQVRSRYLELVKQAKNMEEVLQVQQEINELQEQIEMAEGRISFLNQSAAYSIINLTFYQVLNSSHLPVTEPTFLMRVVIAFETGWNIIKLLLLGLISIWPVLFLVAAVWVGFKKRNMFRTKTA